MDIVVRTGSVSEGPKLKFCGSFAPDPTLQPLQMKWLAAPWGIPKCSQSSSDFFVMGCMVLAFVYGCRHLRTALTDGAWRFHQAVQQRSVPDHPPAEPYRLLGGATVRNVISGSLRSGDGFTFLYTAGAQALSLSRRFPAVLAWR